MTAKIIPFVPVARQLQIRESKIIQFIMTEYVDMPYQKVAKACDAARMALASDMSAEEAIQAAEDVLFNTFTVVRKE